MPKLKFENTGLNTKDAQGAISTKFPPEVDRLLRSLPNRSKFVRDAVLKELVYQGFLEQDKIERYLQIGNSKNKKDK